MAFAKKLLTRPGKVDAVRRRTATPVASSLRLARDNRIPLPLATCPLRRPVAVGTANSCSPGSHAPAQDEIQPSTPGAAPRRRAAAGLHPRHGIFDRRGGPPLRTVLSSSPCRNAVEECPGHADVLDWGNRLIAGEHDLNFDSHRFLLDNNPE